MRTVRVLAACFLAATMAGCSSISSPSSYAPDDFTGLLPPAGEITRGFSTAASGEIQVQMIALNPVPRVGFVTIYLGTYAGSICSAMPGYYIQQAALNQQYPLGRINKGSYCVAIADPNQVLTSPATFTIRMLHP